MNDILNGKDNNTTMLLMLNVLSEKLTEITALLKTIQTNLEKTK